MTTKTVGELGLGDFIRISKKVSGLPFCKPYEGKVTNLKLHHSGSHSIQLSSDNVHLTFYRTADTEVELLEEVQQPAETSLEERLSKLEQLVSDLLKERNA